MKNGEILSIGLNKSAIIKDIWKDDSFKDWHIKIKVTAIENERAQVQIYSPTFLGKDFNEDRFVKIGESILIIQSEEMNTKIEINKISVDSVAFYLTVQSAPPAPELSETFSIEIK